MRPIPSTDATIIARFFLSDGKNLFYAVVQALLSCLSTIFQTVEYFAIAVIVPAQTNSHSYANKLVSALHMWMKTHWVSAIFFLILFLCLRAFLGFANNYVAIYFGLRREASFSHQLFRGLISQPLQTLEHFEPGMLAKALEDDARNLARIPSIVTKYFIAVPIIISSLVLACVLISWRLAFLVLPSIIAVYFLRYSFTRRMKTTIDHARVGEHNASAILVSFLVGIGVIKALRLENSVSNTYHRACTLRDRDRLRPACMSIISAELANILSTTTVIASVAVSFYVLACTMQEIIIIAGLIRMIARPLKEIAESVDMWAHLKTAIDNFYRHHNFVSEQLCVVPKSTDIELRSISFSHGARFSLTPITIKILAGEKVAIVGNNGVGKSTLLKLISGLYPPTRGEITLGGTVIDDNNRSQLRQAITYVSQRPFILSTSVRENIDPHGRLCMSEIVDAARMATIDDFIARLADGYETILINDGAMLSSGQKQKLHLARAIARKTPVLILDEATTSMDHQSERHIFDNLSRSDVTLLVVSHRLDIINTFPRHLRLNNAMITHAHHEKITGMMLT